LRLVVKMAAKFRGYGLPLVDLVSEGNVGLIQAVKKFDPQKGFRFSTYAMWWIKAYIQEYVLRCWSLVKIGTTVAQKKLFFNLQKIKKRLGANSEGNLLPEQIDIIAHDLNVSKRDVIDMHARLQHSDSSLNQMVGGDEDGDEIIGNLVSPQESQEDFFIKSQELGRQKQMLKIALSKLKDREKEIIKLRQLNEKPLTLEELIKLYHISRERIRQIEASALNKIKQEIARLQAEPALISVKY
jgi:RNA polymerase sigma-32 factor